MNSMSIKEASEILGIGKVDEIGNKELKSIYRKLANENHPDKGGDKEKFQLINKAYHLMDSVIKDLERFKKSIGKDKEVIVINVEQLKDLCEYKDIKVGNRKINANKINKYRILIIFEIYFKYKDVCYRKYYTVEYNSTNRFRVNIPLYVDSMNEEIELEVDFIGNHRKFSIKAHSLGYVEKVGIMVQLEINFIKKLNTGE